MKKTCTHQVQRLLKRGAIAHFQKQFYLRSAFWSLSISSVIIALSLFASRTTTTSQQDLTSTKTTAWERMMTTFMAAPDDRFNVSVTADNLTPSPGDIVTYNLFYSTQSDINDFENAVITLTFPTGFNIDLVQFQGTTHVDNHTVSGNQLTVTMVNPLNAGSSGLMQARIRMPGGFVCDGKGITAMITRTTTTAGIGPNQGSPTSATVTMNGNTEPLNINLQTENLRRVDMASDFELNISEVSGTNLDNTSNVTASVTLPPGATLISSTPMGTVNPMTNIVTWTGLSTPQDIDFSVMFPSADNYTLPATLSYDYD